jgi:membrane protein DedA with SNARE-associated domain
MMEQLTHLAEWLVDFVHHFGYLGIFIMCALESTFVPVPSELTMIPAGYLVEQGHMHFAWVLLASVGGTIAGSLLNYFIAYHYGRKFLLNYGKYMLFSPSKMEKLDQYFHNHGEISTFIGRLIPGVRHFIAFPAGLGRMNLRKFCIYTGTGSAIWMTILIAIGYFIGENKTLVKHYTTLITITLLSIAALIVLIYLHIQRKNAAKNASKDK